jgi:hypothetical protein
VARIGGVEREWAYEGATVRLRRLREEIEQIYRTFPELRGQRVKSAPAAVSRKRASPTAADRRKMSAGMRRYWARRKAEAKAKAAKHAG